MTDLAPLPPCPYRKSGAHAIEAVVIDEASSDMTYHCRRCGTVRRVAAAIPLDDLSADQINARLGWTLHEVRE